MAERVCVSDMWLRMYIEAKTPALSLSTSKSKPSDTQHLAYTQATEELRSLRALERESHKVCVYMYSSIRKVS